MSWQHYLYSKLGNKKETETEVANTSPNNSEKAKMIEEIVERIVAMAKVLFGLHMVRSSVLLPVEIGISDCGHKIISLLYLLF